MTLLELLLVMMILGVVLGGGLGVFAALDLGRRQALGLVRNVLRTAENTAIARRAPARVRIDPEAGTLTAEGLRVIGTWQFEGHAMKGAFGLDGEVLGADFVDDGYLGSALSFSGRSDELAQVAVQRDPSFDLSDGFSIACAVRRAAGGAGWLLRIGKVVAIRVNAAGEVEGRFTTEIEKDGHPERGGDVLVRSPDGVLPPARWTRLCLEYDRSAMTLLVDGAPVASVAESAPVWGVDGPLVLSDDNHPFAGEVDSLVVSAFLSDDAAELPKGVTLAKDAPADVWFSAGGGLDRSKHRDPAVIRLDFQDGTSDSVVVGVFGTVQ